MSDLAAFLRRAAAEPFRHGEWDCAMTLANWVRERTGMDAGAALRGRYRTRLGWMRLVRREGSLAALVGRLSADAGLVATADPRPGDVSVVEVPGLGPAGAIRTARGWAVKLHDGIVVAPFETIEAWGLPRGLRCRRR